MSHDLSREFCRPQTGILFWINDDEFELGWDVLNRNNDTWEED
jgi:hypothetical protein